MAVGGRPCPSPCGPFHPSLPLTFGLWWGAGRGEGSVSVCSVCREDSPLYSPLCVMVTFSTPEAVPFAEETFYRFIFAEEIWELEASLQSIGAGVGPPGLNPDRSSN